MKKFWVLCLVLMLVLCILAGCGKKTNQFDSDNLPYETSVITPNAINTNEWPSIWFKVDDMDFISEGKDTHIQTVFVFDKGTVSYYPLLFSTDYVVHLTLGEASKMKDDELIEWLDGQFGSLPHEEQFNSYFKGLLFADADKVGGWNKLKQKTTVDHIHLYSDKTGNSTAWESIEFSDELLDAYGNIDSIELNEMSPRIQIYDTYYCGYSSGYEYPDAYITRCSAETLFLLDNVGTHGLAVD